MLEKKEASIIKYLLDERPYAADQDSGLFGR